MSMHAKIWIPVDDGVQLPQEPFALVEMRLDDDGDYFTATSVAVIPGTDVKFRLWQLIKRYDRVRAVPYLLVCSIGQWGHVWNYEILERLTETRTWKHMVSWHSVYEAIMSEIKERYLVKVAGYDGPFTVG